MDPSLYRYQPLQSERRFRLLELEKCEASEPGALRGVLREASIDKLSPYIALSYAWGPPDFTESIELEGQRLPITPNLLQALQALRPLLRTLDWPTLVWTDAVCINQADVEERAAQVRQMRRIYENASIVFAWLGPVTEKSNGFVAMFGIFRYIGEYLKKLSGTDGRPPPEDEIRTLFQDTVKFLLYDPNGFLHPETRAAVEDFFGRSWWHRAWIVQEATGVQAVSLNIGGYHVTLSIAMNLSRMLHVLRSHPEIDKYERGYMRGMALFNMRENRRLHRVKRIDTLLQTFRDRGASDARDKVYAALGIIADDSSFNFRVDYSESHTASEVYRELAEHLLASSKRLDWLGCDNRPPAEDSNGLPSWVPDWRHRSMTLDLDKFWDSITTSMQDDMNRMYSADQDLSQSQLVANRDMLQVDGVCVDTISQVGDQASYSHSDLETERSWCPVQKDIIYETTGESEFDAYVRTLVADVDQAMPARKLARGRKTDWGILSSPSPHDHLESMAPAAWIDSVNRLDRLKTVTMNRRFARTQHLNLMGLVSVFTAVGDTICVLAGCSVPLVIRRGREGRCRLIGQAYVHGLMDGLAHELVQKGERDIETIVIE